MKPLTDNEILATTITRCTFVIAYLEGDDVALNALYDWMIENGKDEEASQAYIDRIVEGREKSSAYWLNWYYKYVEELKRLNEDN